jgi:hypothetical protein
MNLCTRNSPYYHLLKYLLLLLKYPVYLYLHIKVHTPSSTLGITISKPKAKYNFNAADILMFRILKKQLQMLHIIPKPITNTASGTHTTWRIYCTRSCFCRVVSTDSWKLKLTNFRKKWATDLTAELGDTQTYLLFLPNKGNHART